MKRTQRVLGFVLALIMTFSNVNMNAFAMEVENVSIFEEEKGSEITISGNELKNPEYDNNSEISVSGNELEEWKTEKEESLSDNSLELSVSVNDIKEADVLSEEKNVMEYNDLLDLEFEPITIDEEKVYDPYELVEIVHSMPSYLSESYDLYGDKYTSYYIYNQLDDETRILWEAMEIVYSAYMENDTDLYQGYAETWKIKTNGRNFEQMQAMLTLFKYTHPQYYYLSNKVYYNGVFQEGDEYISLGFGVYEKFQNGTARKVATAQMIGLLDSWSAEIAQLENEEKKVQAIHDKICNKVDYNYDVIADGYIYQDEEEMYFTQSAYSVFCTDLTVCAGYAQAFTWLCNAMDIEVLGITSTDHAWNKVKVNGDWYNVDCTWDDGIGYITYDFYLKNDNYYDTYGTVSSHQEEEQWVEYLPKCTLDSGSYYTTVGKVPTSLVQMASPMITMVRGESTWSIIITSLTENAKIYYTLDGKIPSEARSKSYIYEGPFTVAVSSDMETIEIKAISVCDASQDSEISQVKIGTETSSLAMGNCGSDMMWELDSQGCLNISGIGDMFEFVNQQSTPWDTFAEDITDIIIEDGITGIGNGAFRSLYKLKSVIISETVTSIGSEAFEECNGLEKITIPESITYIGERAFPFHTIIEAEPGSAAYNYAQENGYEFADVGAEEFRIEGFLQESEEFIYTGKEIRQNITIYHKDKLLKENVDYVLKYSNNISAAAYDTLNAPAVTVIMKGQYEGSRTLYYTIFPREITNIDSSGYEQAVAYKEQVVIPEPIIYYQGKRLVENRDFICDYSQLPENPLEGSSYEKGRKYSYAVKGIGNFAGSIPMELVIVDDEALDLNKADVRLEKYTYEYGGNPLATSEVEISHVKIKGNKIDSRYYGCRVQAQTVGTGYVYIEPTEEGKNVGYHGRKEIKITLVADRKIEDTVLGTGWKEEVPFSKTGLVEEGGVYQKETNLLCYEGENGLETLTEGKDYIVRYGKAETVGKVNVIFYGKGRYEGTLKKTYVIVPDTDLSVQWKERDNDGMPVAYYQKDGAVPEFELTDSDGNILRKSKDYNIITKNNRKLGVMYLEVVGIKNYKGYRLKADARILAGNIGNCTMTVKDKKYSEKTDDWKSEVEIRDVNGRKLVAGKDYEKELLFTYENMEKEPIPKVGTVIYVTVTGKNNYADSSLNGNYRICERDLKDLEIVIDSKIYTGEEVTLRKKDIHVYADKADKRAGKELAEECYKIVGYEKNTRIGIASVTLQGKGNYGGIRKCHFAIYKKLFTTAGVERIEMERTELMLDVGQSRKLILYIYPEYANNKTIIWSSSDDAIVSVNKEGVITANKEGSAVVKAV
ncbi:MAG: leucine-rich repeat protein, partial [Lachnospiraceae bacterium]|nr:leucine-rich repeat protein [Lachnospiraceae bacterium]